jgi:hypothetical protein
MLARCSRAAVAFVPPLVLSGGCGHRIGTEARSGDIDIILSGTKRGIERDSFGFKFPLLDALSPAVCLIDGTGTSIDCISSDEWANLRYKYAATLACLWRRTRFSRDNVEGVFIITRS